MAPNGHWPGWTKSSRRDERQITANQRRNSFGLGNPEGLVRTQLGCKAPAKQDTSSTKTSTKKPLSATQASKKQSVSTAKNPKKKPASYAKTSKQRRAIVNPTTDDSVVETPAVARNKTRAKAKPTAKTRTEITTGGQNAEGEPAEGADGVTSDGKKGTASGEDGESTNKTADTVLPGTDAVAQNEYGDIGGDIKDNSESAANGGVAEANANGVENAPRNSASVSSEAIIPKPRTPTQEEQGGLQDTKMTSSGLNDPIAVRKMKMIHSGNVDGSNDHGYIESVDHLLYALVNEESMAYLHGGQVYRLIIGNTGGSDFMVCDFSVCARCRPAGSIFLPSASKNKPLVHAAEVKVRDGVYHFTPSTVRYNNTNVPHTATQNVQFQGLEGAFKCEVEICDEEDCETCMGSA